MAYSYIVLRNNLFQDGFSDLLAAKGYVEANASKACNRGYRYSIYKLCESAFYPVKEFEHDWQRLAYSGDKVAAIKTLRNISGIKLSEAKTIVESWIERECR